MVGFPEPPDLEIDFVHRIGDSQPKSFEMYNVSNPHPGFGKDPNILNEFGHTKYPMWVDSKVTGTRVVVNSEEELAEHTGEVAPADANPPTKW